MSEEMNERGPELEDGAEVACGDIQKPHRSISISTFIFSAIALVLAAVMTTYACCGAFYKNKIAEAKLESIGIGESYDKYDAIALIEALFKTYGYYDGLDDDKIAEYVIKAYVAATGDVHARYFTAEEYNELLLSDSGSGVGIGISVVYSEVAIGEEMMGAIDVIAVSPGSPAEDAGLLVGDLIMWVNTDDGERLVDELGYNVAVAALKGDVGTEAKFSTLTEADGAYLKKDFSVERQNVSYRSVTSRVSETDASVGIVKIGSFDTVTPA